MLVKQHKKFPSEVGIWEELITEKAIFIKIPQHYLVWQPIYAEVGL